VWGPGDGRPVSEMKVDVDLLLQEYILSRDIAEATQCVKQFNAPYFYHEIVKRAITCSLDKTPDDRQAIHNLLRHLRREDVVSSSQMAMGYQLVRERLPDIVLDTPAARTLFDEFVSRAKADDLVSRDF
jgi:programmed cell death protein 4